MFYQKSPQYNPQFTYGEPYRRVYSRSGSSSNYGKFERTGTQSSDGRRYPGNVLFVPTVTGGLSWLFMNVFQMGYQGLWWGVACSRIIPTIICIAYYCSGKWRTRTLLKEPKKA